MTDDYIAASGARIDYGPDLNRLRRQIALVFALALVGVAIAVGSVLRAEAKRSGVSVCDEAGVERVSAQVNALGATLALRDASGHDRILLFAPNEAGQARIELFDEKHNRRLVVGGFVHGLGEADVFLERPASSLVLFDEQGAVIWKVPAQPWLEQ